MPLLDYGPPPILAYDSVSSASSSSPTSPPPLGHRLRRTRSPSPSPTSRHISHLYTHHYHHPFVTSPRPYSPSSREADIARLLDPTYASPPSHSLLTKSPRMLPKEVYVDHHGDLHDPDFRDFPPFGHPRQPRWERSYADDNDDDDDDDDDCHMEKRRASFEHQRRRPSSSTIYHSPPVYHSYEEPASYESRYLEEDEDEDEQLVHAPLGEKPFHCRSRSPTKRSKDHDEKPCTDGDHVVQGDSEWTPTCTQSLRRQWQAFTLSVRFRLFRTKRRLRRRLTG